MNKSARIYIAGHRGLVGSAIVRKLQQEGYTNLILRTSAEIDLRNQAAVATFFNKEKPEFVFLSAAKVGGIHANNTYPADFIRDNIQIQTNVIDESYKNGTKKLVFLGSSCIYPKMAPQPIREDSLLTSPLEPTNEWYAIAKIAGIKMCQAYRRQYGFNAISLMPTNLYGPNDNFDLDKSHVLPAMIRKFHLAKLMQQGNIQSVMEDENRYGKIPDDILHAIGLTRKGESNLLNTSGISPKVVLWGTGTPKREFLHVEDMADGCFYLMQHYNEEKIVNVGSGTDQTIRELATIVQDTVAFDGAVIWDNSKPDGTPQKLMDVGYLHSQGWKAKIDLRQGIKEVYNWYRQQR